MRTPLVRSAVAQDASELHAIAAVTFPLACPEGTPAEAIANFVSTHLSEHRFAEYLSDPKRDILIVEVDSLPAGYSMLVAEPSIDPEVTSVIATESAIELSKLYLLPGAHGSGAATALMSATIERARQRGADAVWLGVNQRNARANRFYEKGGFENVGTKHFMVGGKFEEDFVRVRSI